MKIYNLAFLLLFLFPFACNEALEFPQASHLPDSLKKQKSDNAGEANIVFRFAAERKAELKKWEATPAGIMYKKWEASPAGKKVYAAEANIRKQVQDSTNMEGVVTSLSLPPGSRLGFGVMVRINGDDYILTLGLEKSDKNFFNFNNEFQQLHSLKVNDKIIIKSHWVSHAPKYSYPIVSGDYVERDSKIIYKRSPRKGGC